MTVSIDRANATGAQSGRGLPPICKFCGRELTDKKNIKSEIRTDEGKLDQIATILSSRDHNNVAITGKAGTGKTALVSALAAEVAAGKYPALTGRRIVEINIDSLLRESYSIAEKGERMANLMKEAERERIILFFDEGHRLCEFGESNSLANILKPYLTDDKVQVIIATTTDEYKAFIARDPAFRRRFEEVLHSEPDAGKTCEILRYVAERRYPEVTVEDEALNSLVELGIRYIPDRNNPDKSLSLLDNAVAWEKNHRGKGVVTKDIVCGIISERIGVAKDFLSADVKKNLKGLSDFLAEKFPGWENACGKIAESVSRAQTRNLRESGPLSSTILCGEDLQLMTDIAKATVNRLGCVGKGAVYTVDVSRIDNSDPYTKYVLKNPQAAVIFTEISSTTPLVILGRLNEVLRSGELKELKDGSGRNASYSRAHVFFLCRGKIEAARVLGFGNDAGGGTLRIDGETAAALEAMGADKEEIIAVGAPDGAKRNKIYGSVFLPKLADGAKECGCGGQMSLSGSAEARVIELLGAETAWSDMHDAIEEIVRAALASDAADIKIDFADGRFIAVPSLTMNIDPSRG